MMNPARKSPSSRVADVLRASSVRARLVVTVGVLLALGAVNVGAHVWATRQRARVLTELRNAVARQEILLETIAALENQNRQVRVVSGLLGADAVPSTASERERTHAAIDAVPARLEAPVLSTGPGGEPAVREMRARAQALATSWKTFYDNLSTNPSHAISELVLVGEPLARALLEKDLPEAVRREKERIRTGSEALARTDRTTSRVVWVLFGLSSILGSLLAFGTLRGLLGALGALKAGAERVGMGEFGHEIPLDDRTELGEVARSFNEMARRLRTARDEVEVRNAELADTVERLRRARQELIQSEKLGALGGMLAGLAHEINNPLTSVLGYGQLLRQELDERGDAELAELRAELVDPIISEGVRARNLVRNLLQFSRSSDSALAAVDLAEALHVAIGLRRRAFALAGVRLTEELPDGILVTAESQRLQQVFLNVINNALDALSGGGGTTLCVRVRRVEPNWVSVTFEDDGPGLKEPERIFDPFYTTKPVGAGTGLGLTLVHRFVEEFGGTVTASSRYGGGACFEIRLRSAAPLEEVRPVEPPARVRSAPPARRTVLVVEDEEPLRALQGRLLGRLDVEVLLAASGEEARDVLEARDVDLVISDIKMPGEMDGVALFQWVLRERPPLADRFLFVTGNQYDQKLSELLRTRPDRFVTKPFEVDTYLDRVGGLLREGERPAEPAGPRSAA
ncbi:MAG TPA: ATP-binding protein [Longimicrobiaceae bacterium]|nr:ATP-binding protein [Longimicrobiaceae bacterium]